MMMPRYTQVEPQSPEPTGTRDGRNIDTSLGILDGEASVVAARHPERAASLGKDTIAWQDHPGESPTYHEQPVLKTPVWKGWIPTYFFVGGVTGACAALGAAAQLTGARSLVRPARVIAAAGTVVSAGLLVADLGRPLRFLNMLRVFRPTSPMNVGAWILTGTGATCAAAVVLPRGLGDAAALASAPFGVALASYTGVLLASTAVPTWLHGRRTLPALFAASAAASAASVLDLLPGSRRSRRVVGVFGAIGRAAELALGLAYERELAARGDEVARHLRGSSLWRAAKALTAASLVLSLAGSRRTGGVLGVLGGLAVRFAVTEAGKSSARDPRATFEPQRRDRDARTATASKITQAVAIPEPLAIV